ncbi:MAG: hypothetical protein J6V44_00075 [Methanobrevibacter sp.]|nr:hypothetical protein [Methanobrevibacter sp.]
MSKLQRTESVDLQPAQERAKEAIAKMNASTEHPRKSPLPKEMQQEGQQQEGSVPRTSTRHPNGHKVKEFKEVEAALYKTEYLPLSDSTLCGDVWFQPHSIQQEDTSILKCVFEELVDAHDMHVAMHQFSVSADDLLKMLYLTEMIVNDYYASPREEYEDWFIGKFTEALKEDRSLDMANHGALATRIMKNFSFEIGKGTHFEVYFQKKCVHVYNNAPEVKKNFNCVFCKALRGKFEYIIEARIFVLNEDIHASNLGDGLLLESQLV